MKKKLLEKNIDKDEVIVEMFGFSIFNSLPSLFLCVVSIVITFLMMSGIPSIIENKKELVIFYQYGIDIMKGISILLSIIFLYSLLKNLFGFIAFTNKRVILFRGILFTTLSELNYSAYSGNDLKRSLLGRILFYGRFSIYGYGMQVLFVPLTHSYKRVSESLHNIKNI